MIVHVALPIPVSKTFSYSVPEKWKPFLNLFSRVTVPFRHRTMTGYVVGIEKKDDAELKTISDVIDLFPLINSPISRLCEWSSYYYVTPVGMVLKCALPQTLKIENYLSIRSLSPCTSMLEGVLLKQSYKIYGKDIIFKYFQDNLIELRDIFVDRIFQPFQEKNRIISWNIPENKLYIGGITSRLTYYMSCISELIDEGKNVLMLLPDYYAAGDYYYKTFSERFKNKVIWYGSAVKTRTRMDSYFKARKGEGFLILGNRSCLFLPIMDLSLIIIERQEEDDYRNEEGFNFNANILAIKRGEIEGIPVISGSVSPSMTMFKSGEEGKFSVIGKGYHLEKKYSVVLMEKSLGEQNALPEKLVNIIKEAVQQIDNIAVFIPRRGYIAQIKCLECKRVFLCPICKGMLSLCQQEDMLVCGNCDKNFEYNAKCFYCGGNIIHTFNAGTEYVEKKLNELFMESCITNITAETIKVLREITPGISDTRSLILVGTQSLSKIYDMSVKKLILLGWEELVRMAGYRAEEKMFQILMNLLDILNPEEIYFFMNRKLAVNPIRFFDTERFYTEELKKRKYAEFPPYVRFFLIEVERKGEKAGLKILNKIESILGEEGLTEYVTGPVKETRANCYKWKLILKGDGRLFHKALLSIYDLPGVYIEADPLNL